VFDDVTASSVTLVSRGSLSVKIKGLLSVTVDDVDVGSYTVSECSGTISVGYRVENGSTARNIGRPAGVALWVVNKNNVHVLMPVG
ncbi:UNVERIFIED_CONTAM: hypothetical protein NY603_32730, partial [Bacteroidetes bacterium 56_B9]